MRNNTAKKLEHFETAENVSAEIFDFAKLTDMQIATQAEMACHLRGNKEAPDFEAFLTQYGEGIASDFA